MTSTDGFDEAFDDLYHAALLVTRRILGNRADAEDAAAETLARALLSWRRVSNHPNPKAWVARVAANQALDQLRRRRRRHPATPAGPMPDTAELTASRLELATAMGQLARRQRQVVAMRYLADLDDTAVAASLGISVNSVKKHTQRGLAALRAQLGPTWQEATLCP